MFKVASERKARIYVIVLEFIPHNVHVSMGPREADSVSIYNQAEKLHAGRPNCMKMISSEGLLRQQAVETRECDLD